MNLKINKDISTEKLRNFLQSKFPDKKVKSPLLNKNIISVQNGWTTVVIQNQNKGLLKVTGGINTQNFGIILGITIGAFLGFIGAIVFLGVVYFSTKDSFEAFESEVAAILKDEFSLVESVV